MMKKLLLLCFTVILFVVPFIGNCQNFEKVSFNSGDVNDYYLAVKPVSNHISATLVVLCTFRPPESMLPETKLHNVASANNLLTIYLSMGAKLYADTAVVGRINSALKNVIAKYNADTSTFVLCGFDFGGTIALRYTELSYAQPSQFVVQPKAVFAAASFVDLFGVWHWADRQIKKNPGVNSDGKIIMDMLAKNIGSIADKAEIYKSLTPFYAGSGGTGNEEYLKTIPVRLYYDTSIAWQLTAKHNSLYDTNIPDGSELINRLLTIGNSNAEFIEAKQPGVRSNGVRSASAPSIVDETDCIQWIKKKLNLFDPGNPLAWQAPYKLPIPDGWRVEHSFYPPPFAPGLAFNGMEDIRFTPGWADAKSDDYWSYSFLLWLDGKPAVDASLLQDNLKRYYDGLIAGTVSQKDIQAKNIPTVVNIKKTKTALNDAETYTGALTMLDYMNQQPIALNCFVHIRNVKDKKHTVIISELSPKPFEHVIWTRLDALNKGFREGD